MNRLTRRRALSMFGLSGAAAALAACSITKSGTTTTVTIDVAKITTDGKAIIAGLTAALAAPSIVALLGTNYAIAETALVAASAALTEIESLTGGTMSESIDTSKLQALVTSLLADAQTALTLVQGVVTKLSGTIATQIGNYVAAVLTLIPFVQLAAGFASARPGTGLMTEAQALAIAGR